MTAPTPPDLDALVAFTRELAGESGELILRYYRRPLDVARKADASPVTEADRGAEALLRRRIGERYPEHAVLGEEEGRSGPTDTAYQWILDPIDGTKSFIHGVPLFGTLIALMDGPEPLLGAIHLPATGELLIGARGRATTLNGEPVQVRETRSLDEATVLFTDPGELHTRGYGPGFRTLAERARVVRGWGDCYGHFLVAAGRADAMFDPILNQWDVAALKPCVLGAGGGFSTADGATEGLGENALSSNGLLHEEVLAVLNGRGPVTEQ